MKSLITLAVGIVIMAAPALGASVQYTDRATFNAAAGPLTLETLEDDVVHQLAVPEALAGSGLVIDTNPRSVTTEVTTGEMYSSNTTPGGEKHLRFMYEDDYMASCMSSALPMTAFGFDITGFQDFPNQGGFAMDLYLGVSPVESLWIPDPGDFGPNFHGVISDTLFDTVVMTFLRGSHLEGDFVGLDDIAFNAVPEPASATLLVLGGLGLVARRRRARRRD